MTIKEVINDASVNCLVGAIVVMGVVLVVALSPILVPFWCVGWVLTKMKKEIERKANEHA